jgi:acyl-homoserine-lactone acylase
MFIFSKKKMRHFLLTMLFFSSVYLNDFYAQSFSQINPLRIEIIRDDWGVPHIFAPTDAEVAYGLAWANAEDSFKEMQDLLITGKGLSGLQNGMVGVRSDFFRHVIGARRIVDERISELPEEYLKYLDGYVQGINAFAMAHKDQLINKRIFPVTTEDLLTTYVIVISFMTDAAGAMEKIYSGRLDNEEVKGLGSNAYAVRKERTIDDRTYLAINPHMQMNGTFSFYEAHLCSEEGLNIHGAIFQGGTSVFMGANPNLGWGMTWNYFNRGDIYKLKMHPKKKHHYLFDGGWIQLETEKVKLQVKWKGLTIPVKRKVYRSVHGPVLESNESKGDFYAFRYPAFMDIKAPYQWYRMNKTTNLQEFKSVLEMMAIGLFNIVYADKEDNIFYISSGQVPYREDSIAVMKVIPGHDSRYVWQRLHTIAELPHEENPACGFVYNTNNTPFFATCEINNTMKLELKKYLDDRPGQNNRAVVLEEFLEQYDQLEFTEFQEIKFDNSYHPDSYIMQVLKPFFQLNPADFPDVSEVLNLFQSWGQVADKNDAASTIVMVTTDKIFRKKKYNDEQFVKGADISLEDFLEALRETKKWLLKYYGHLEVPLREVFLCQKGDSLFPSPGFPDALAANYGVEKDGKYIVRSGDTYTQFVAFSENGLDEIRTLVPFGNSNDPNSPFYFNQSELFSNQQTKEVTMDRELLRERATRIYHPQLAQ